MKKIFLHFINRELHQSLDIHPDVLKYIEVVRLCTVFFDSQMVCNISQIYEVLFEFPNYIDELIRLNKAQILVLDSSHWTFEEFFQTRQEYYAHDLARYPMYSVTAKPDIFKRASVEVLPCSQGTTEKIVSDLQGIIASDSDAPVRGLRNSEANLIRHNSRPIGVALLNRDHLGLTYALFPARGVSFNSATETMSLRRALSASYVNHYMDKTNGTIVTGLPGLSYYDHCEIEPRLLTMSVFMTVVAQALGISDYLSSSDRWREWERIEDWSREDHLLFTAKYAQFAGALDAAHRRIAPAQNKCSWAVAQIRLHVRKIRASTDNYRDVLRECTLRLDIAGNLMCQRLAGFGEEWMTYKGKKGNSLLVATATNLEDSVFDAMTRLRNLALVGLITSTTNSIAEYRGIRGVDLFHVRSSAGSIGPSGATLVLSEAVKKVEPDFVVSCGICFGMDPQKQKLGDVVVSERVAFYEPGRVQERLGQPPFVSRGGRVYAGARLLDRAKLVKRSWSAAEVHFGLLASGEKLVDSADFKQYLLAFEPEIIAGEMEATGLFSVAERERKEAIVIKGIADWGENKGNKDQLTAAQNAFSFMFEVLEVL